MREKRVLKLVSGATLHSILVTHCVLGSMNVATFKAATLHAV